MQLYFPHLRSPSAAIALFDFITESRDSNSPNVIFNSDLELFDLHKLKGGIGPSGKYPQNNKDLYSYLGFLFSNWEESKGQLFQDLYVLHKLNKKQNGVFVEIGTCDPKLNNNTYVLEKNYGWLGICVEPGQRYSNLITSSRTAKFEEKAIYTESNKILNFFPDTINAYGGGVILEFLNYNKFTNQIREEMKQQYENNSIESIKVESITITDLLEKHNIPKDFDYLSYDTTGITTDIEIFKMMFADRYYPMTITVGHNFKDHRPELYQLMLENGYQRDFEILSKWDDWYSRK